MPRVSLHKWLRAIETRSGPMPPELRHLCYVLARFMNGDGANGCFPGTRTLAERIGVHRATVGRWLAKLHELGWVDVERRIRQYGRPGGHYFPAMPLAHPDAPISDANGASERANSSNAAFGAPSLAHAKPELAHEGGKLAHLSAPDSLTDSLTEKSAASPASADERSARASIPDSERTRALRSFVVSLREKGFADAQIADNSPRTFEPRPTIVEVQAIK